MVESLRRPNTWPAYWTRVFSPNGALIQETTHAAGQLHGPYRTWWDNGAIKEEGAYIRGARAGEFRWYKDDGSLLKLQKYPHPVD